MISYCVQELKLMYGLMDKYDMWNNFASYRFSSRPADYPYYILYNKVTIYCCFKYGVTDKADERLHLLIEDICRAEGKRIGCQGEFQPFCCQMVSQDIFARIRRNDILWEQFCQEARSFIFFHHLHSCLPANDADDKRGKL